MDGRVRRFVSRRVVFCVIAECVRWNPLTSNDPARLVEGTFVAHFYHRAHLRLWTSSNHGGTKSGAHASNRIGAAKHSANDDLEREGFRCAIFGIVETLRRHAD